MPLVKPKDKEKLNEIIDRCMNDPKSKEQISDWLYAILYIKGRS